VEEITIEEITIEDIEKAVRNLRNNKVPGMDGILRINKIWRI